MTTKAKQKVGEVLQSISEKHAGELTPERVLAFAKSDKSPIHHLFCWDDTKAAREYRLIQAGALIRRIKVRWIDDDKNVHRMRQFINVRVVNPDEIGDDSRTKVRERGIYLNCREALGNYEEQVLADCKRDAKAFAEKYAALKAAAPIIASIKFVFDD